MSEATGTVEIVKQERSRFAILLSDGNWYSGFGEAPVIESDFPVTVSFTEVRKNGKTYRNLDYVRPA